jgi:hypothetical protein
MTENSRRYISVAILELTGIALVGWYLLNYQLDTIILIFKKLGLA